MRKAGCLSSPFRRISVYRCRQLSHCLAERFCCVDNESLRDSNKPEGVFPLGRQGSTVDVEMFLGGEEREIIFKPN